MQPFQHGRDVPTKGFAGQIPWSEEARKEHDMKLFEHHEDHVPIGKMRRRKMLDPLEVRSAGSQSIDQGLEIGFAFTCHAEDDRVHCPETPDVDSIHPDQ